MGKKIESLKKFPKKTYETVKEQVGESYAKGPVYLAKDYTAATLGSFIPSFPFLAGFELFAPKLFPFLENLNSSSFEETMTKFFYLGLAMAYPISKLKKGTRHGSNADVENGNSINKKLAIHDSIFQAIGNSLINVGMYKNLSYGLVRTTGNLGSGILDGIGLDFFDVMFGTGDSKRIPNYFKNLNQKVKYGIVGGLIGLSTFSMNEIYKYSDYVDSKNEIKQSKLEKEVEPSYKMFSRAEVDRFSQADGSRVGKNYKSLEGLN